jgi:hypothetical protein
MAGSSVPGPVTVILQVGGNPPATTVVPGGPGTPGPPTPTTTTLAPTGPPSPGHAGVPTGHLPFTGAPVILEGTAALGLVTVGILAAIAARRHPRTPAAGRAGSGEGV